MHIHEIPFFLASRLKEWQAICLRQLTSIESLLREILVFINPARTQDPRPVELPGWMNILFVDGGKADLEEIRGRWLAEGNSLWKIRRKTVSWLLYDNLWSKLVNLANDLTESVKGVLPSTYPSFEHLEEPFAKSYSKSAIVTTRFSLFLGIFLYAIFGILDVYCIPNSKEITWAIRYAFMCPILLLLLMLTFFPISHKVYQLAMSAVSLIAGYGIIAMIFLSQPPELAYSTYYAGLILVLIYLYTVLKIRLTNAVVVGSLIVLGYEYVAIFYQEILSTKDGVIIFANNNFFFVSAMILGVFACSLIEKSSKDEYVMRSLIVEEVFQEIRYYFGLYALEDDQGVRQLLEFLSEKPRDLDEMLSNYYLYKISKLRKISENEN